MVGLIVVVVIVVLVAIGLLARGATNVAKDTQAQQDGLAASPDSLRYTVPAGQDPAVVVAELHKAGYAAAEAPDAGGLTGGTDILIDVEEGRPEREQVRDVLARVDRLNLGDDDPAPDAGRPRFADE